jgi:hypothetical protein
MLTHEFFVTRKYGQVYIDFKLSHFVRNALALFELMVLMAKRLNRIIFSESWSVPAIPC